MTSTTTAVPEAARRAAEPAERIEELRALAGLYRLLGRVLDAEVDRPLLDALRGELREPLAEAGVALGDDFFSADPDRVLEALAEEYTALLVAPGGVLPYASVFETGRMFQGPADRAEAAYREAGLAFRPRMSGEFADHIGTMLGFVGHLMDSEAEALAAGDAALAADARARWQEFLVEQLGGWGPGWCQRARRAALHPLYRQMIALGEQALWSEIARLVGRRRFKELVALNGRPPVKLDYNADFRKASGL